MVVVFERRPSSGVSELNGFLRLAACLLLLAGSIPACTRLGVDGVLWQCTSDAQCGSGRACVEGLCGNPPGQDVAQSDTDISDTSPDFDSDADSGGPEDAATPDTPPDVYVAPAVYDPTDEVLGQTLVQWGADYFRWFWGTPFSVHPLARRTPFNCLSGQRFDVFMLYPDRGTVRCSVPIDTPILVPIVGLSNDSCAVANGPGPGALQSFINDLLDNTVELSLVADGQVLLEGATSADLGAHLIEASRFDYVEAPEPDNIHTQFYGVPTAVDCRAAWHAGVYALLQPLSPGTHTIIVKSFIPVDEPPTRINATFTLVVGPPPTLLAPVPPRLGRTGEEWLEAWYRWALIQPATNHPLADGSGANCQAEQPSDVFFLGGALDDASVIRSCRIPANRPLAFPLISGLADNAGLQPASHRSDETLAQLAQAATEVDATLSLDGRIYDLAALAPHRVAPFDFGYDLPESDSILEAYLGRDAVAGPVAKAFAAGVFVVLEPLHPGEHVITLERRVGPATSTVRYQLTVE